uniref:Coiled-coil domain-containing protein 168 n=1 Tax=Callorhinus ursinus TaxID=34884 RepID=A0A3Q7PAL0_CALUR|nr:coiled-coil domain-containing protein 168 [Callorhinus ursinus]
MSKQFYFFKKAVQNRLEDNTFWTLWELVESWTQNDWVAIFFIIFLGIIVEIILIKICTSFTKKPALPEKGSSSAQEKEDSCLKSMQFDNCPIPSSSEERVDDFSERTITSSLTSEENEGDFEDRVSTPDEVIWSSSSESKYQVSHFSESHMISSNGTSSSLSLFRSEVKEFSPSCGGYPENEQETVQFSFKKLFSIMKTNKNKNLVFSSDFNFSRSSRITIESEDLNVAPCPPAHLFLSRDQVRLLEENVRNQTALKSKTTLESKTTYLYSRLQESLIQNQHSVKIGISAQPQDSFPGQNAPQNQHFYEARYTSQAQQFVNNQESVNSQSDIMARYFALPQDLVRKPFSSSMQDSSQTQDMDRSQHLLNVSYSFETQDSVKGLESDKHFDKAQYSVWLKDSNKIKYLIRGQNAIFKNARFLILTLSPNSFAEEVLQIKSIKPEGQKQIASSELSQYSAYGSGPLSPILKRQKNRRKTLHSKSKLSLKVPSQKSKKTPTPRVFQMTVCHTSKPSNFGCKYNAKKEELHQRKGISDMALHLTYVSKLIPPYVKKYARKKLVKVMPGVIGCRHSLSPDAQNVSYVGSIEKRGTSGSTKNKKQHGRENKGQITISPKIPPQLEQSFMINTFQLQSPCSSLIEMTWKNKESLEDPITQAKEIGIAEFRAPNSKKTSDLHIPKQEASLKEALSERWQKFVSSPEVESNRRLKTLEDLKSTENSRLPLSSGEKLPTSSPEMQKCFPDGNTQKQKDFLEIVLETSEVNLLITLGIKEHEGSEQLASVKTQDSTEDVIMKEKKPLLTLHVTGCDNLSESEGLERNTRSNIKNMQGKRIFATFQNATNTTIPEPPEREMHSGLKGKTDTSTTGVSHSVVKLEKLPDEKKTWDAKYIEKRCIFKKPQEHDREEEEQTFQEAFPELTQDFSLSLQLKQKPKYVRFEIKQSSSGSRKTQSKEQEVQPQTLPTETVLGTSPCPTMDPFQIEVKQSRDRPTGRGTADPENPLPVLENPRVGEVLIETTECGVPFGGSPRKIPDDHITEEKSDLQRVLPATALGSFIIYMLPLSHFKRQQIRKKLSGAKRVLSPKSVIMKVKKPTNLLMPHIRRHGTASLRRRLRGNFKILIKEMLQDKIVADVLVNVTYPHMSILPRIRTHGRLSAENRSQSKLKQEKSEDEREEKYSDSINKGSDSGNTLEEVKLQDEVRGDKEAPPEAVLHDSWNLRLDANPEKELKAEEDIPQPITFMETLTESVYSPIMDLTHVENMKKSLTTQADLKCTADSETPLPTSEKSLAGDPPNRTRESGVLDYGSDTREMGYFSAETSSAELPKDLPATFPETFNCHMPILTHSKMNKNKVRFSPTEGSVKPRSVHTKTMKPSVSQVFNSTGQRKKLDSKYKAKLEKINQANGLLYEFINTLYSPMQSFCHAQLKQGELGEVRPRYVDFFDKSRAFHDREEKVEDGEEVEQKTLLEAASQHTQYLWPDACQGKETHFDEPDSALDCLTQELSVNEQDAQHQEWFVQTALQTGHQKGPREAEELKKTSETENDVTAPMGPKIPSPKAETAPENSQGFIVNAYQKENCDLVKSDEELKQPRSINIQEQPRIHGTQAVLGSASCPMLDQFQFGKLESYARFSPPKSGEAKMDGIIFSTREYGVPSDANHQKEQAGGIEKKDTVTFDLCIPALSTFKRKKHLKKNSDEKTLVNLKCGILKAKKPSVSYILSIKGGASPNHRKELGYNSTTKLEEMDQGEKMAEREKGMLGERSLSSKQVKQALSPREENITSDDTKENSLQDAEEERSEQETLKVILQHSQHFKFCSGQREELDLHQSENQGRGNILFVFEQDISQQMPHTDSTQGEKPKKSYQTQNGAIYTASSKLPLLKPKKSLTGQVLMGTMKGGVLSVGSHMGELYRHNKEENAEFKKDLQATVLESLDVSTPDLSESKRQRKTFTSRALKNKMSPKCVIMKARKTPISPTFKISGNSYLKNLRPKTLKSQIIDLLIHIKCSGVLEDLIAERKEGLAQELPATILESLDSSTLALPALKRKRNNLKYIDKRNKMSLKWVTSKAKKAAISQTLTITKRGTQSHRRQFKCYFKIMMKQGKPTADMILNAISSPVPVLLDMKMHNRIKESDVSWKMRFSHKLQQQEQSPDGERACCADSSDRRGPASNDTKEVKDQREEVAPRTSRHSSFIAGKMKEPHFVKSELELKNSAKKKIPEPLNTAPELQQQTLFTRSVLQCVSCSILNSLPLEKQPKRTKTQKDLKYAKGPKMLSPVLEKSIPESLFVTTQSDIPSERGPRKELARSTPEGKTRLQKDLQVRTLKCFDFSMPASSEFEGWRNAAQIPKSRNGKVQMASILKTINITKSDALSQGKEQDFILENMGKEMSQSMSGIFVNTFPSPTPVSPAIKTHKKVKAKRDPLRNKSNIIQPEQHEGERLCPYSNKWSNSSSTSESRLQNAKEREGNRVLFEAGLQFLYNIGRRKDQNMLITEQDVQRQTLVSENKLESPCSPLIPFQTEELSKNIPSQKDIPYGIGQKIPCPKSGKAAFDYFSTDETECSTISDGSPARKLDVHIAVSLQPEEEEEDIKTPKVMKHRVDQNILPTKSGNSVLVDPGDKSSKRKMGAKKPRVLQRDLLTMSTISVLFDSESQEKILKFSGRKNLRRPKYVTTKAKKKALYSQMLNITEHDNLYCRKEQNYNLKSTINDMQQSKSIANALLSPTPVSTDNKIDTEMHSTSEAEMDQPRVTLYSRTSAELGKSPCDREVWKANSVDPQNRSSNTMKMNVQHESKEENIKKMLSESVPHYNHRFSFSAHHMKNFGSYQSESELSNLEVRSTWNLSCAAQRMRQEKCFRETILEPVSRHVMNFLQVETEKKSLHTQERIKCMAGLKTPFPKARKSETGSIQCGVLWGGNPRRKWDSYIFEKKAWNQNDLVRVLKSSGSSSLDSCEPKSQSYTLEFVGKKSIINPKHVTLKAKKRSVSQLLNITGCITGSHRKVKGCKFQYKMKTQWFEGVGEASLLAAEGTKIPPPKLVTDEHSLDATARGTLYNRTLHRNLHGHITEEKAESWENSATTFLEPIDFFTPIFSDSESQINTVRLLEEKITLNPRCLTLKGKEPAISQILKIRGRFTTKRRKKLGSNLKTKMQQMSQGKNVADTFPNTIYFTPDTCDIERQSRFKIGMDRISRFSHVQPTQMQLPVEGLVISQPVNITGHAALSINEQQGKKIDRRREKTVLNVDLKFVYDSMPILSHLKMEPSPSTWDIYEESSGKRNALNKANASSAYAYIPMYPKIIKHKAKAKTADVKNTMHIRRMKLKAKKPPVSQLFNTTGCGTRRNKKERRCDIKKQKEFRQDKTIADLFLNTVCDSGSLSSQSKQFTEVEREKSRPRKPINVPPQLELEKSLNKRKMSSSESTDIKSAISRNIKTLKQRIREQKEKRQIVSRDILPQCRDQLVTGQRAKKELDHVKIGVALKREVYPGLASQKREINYTTFNIPRIRTRAECEFPVAPRVKHKDADVIKCSVSIPWGRGVSKKNNISLNSKEQNIFLTELGASQQKTHKEQEFQKQGSISLTIRGSFAYPIMEPPRLKNTGRVAEEDIYTNKRSISHLLRREDIKETDISQGSKGQKFLCTNLVGQQTMSAAQKGEVKPAGVPESIVESVSRPNKERLQVTQAVNTKKEDVSPSLSLRVNPGRKEQSKLTDIPLRLNGQKVTSEKLGAKQLRSSNQNKENILESISSCMLDQLYNEKLKKKVSAKGVSSKVLSSVVDKALNEAATPVDQPSLSLHNRRKEHQKESTCKVLPKSVSRSSMDVLQIKLPCVKKTLKTPTYHTANTEGIGLLAEGKEEEHPECIHYISPKSASHSLRDVLQSKIPCEKKASEEVANTVDYIPSREKISSLITGKESKVHTGKGQSGMKLTSLCTSLRSLSHTNVNSRIKVGQDKSGIPRSCLPPLKLQVSPNVRKPSFAESINRGSLSNVRESKHLPQGKKEDGVYVKDLRGLKCVTFKGRKTPFEHTLHGKEPQWKNKEQEEMRQRDKSDPDRVQSKRLASIPSSPHVGWDPGIKEVLMRGITRFCPPSLTLQELSDTMGICAEPADDILSSIKKAKYMPQKDGGEMALEEIRHPKRIALKAKRTPVAHELQLNIKEKEKKMQEDQDKPVGIQSKSRVSISFPPYSEVDTRIKGEEALLIKTRPSFLQTELQESSDRGKIAYKQSIRGDTSNSVKESKKHYIIQEEEEKVKMVKVILSRKKRSPILQLDIKEQEEKTQKIKGEPNVLATNTSTCIPAPSHLQLDTRIKKADCVTEATRCSLPELSQQKSSDAVKKANKKSTDGDITSDVQETKEHTPQKEETKVEKSAKRDTMQPKDKDLKGKKALLQDIPLNLKEQVKEGPEGEEQGTVDRGGKGEQEVVLPTNWASASLTHRELNTRIGEEDRQEITGSAVSRLQLRKSSDAGKVVYTKSAGDDISDDVRVVQEYEPQQGEDRRKVVNRKFRMYPKGTTSKAKVLPLPHVLFTSGGCDAQIREVQTSVKEKLRYIQERSELGQVLTRPSLPRFKLNKSIEGKEEKQVSRPFLPPSWQREASNAEKLKHTVLPLSDVSNDSKRTKYTTQREEDKANTFEKDIMHSKYMALRAKKSPLSLILKTKRLQVNIKEQGEVGQEGNKETVVLLSKIHPFLISSTHLKWNTIKNEEGEPGIIRNDAPRLELQESLPSGQIASTDSPDSHVQKGDQCPRQAERSGVQTGARRGSVQPRGTDFKAKTSPPSHTFSVTEHGALNERKEPQWHMREKVEQGQQRTGDPDAALTKTSPSTASPSYHRSDTRTKVDKDLLAVTGFSPSQLLCSKSSSAGKIRYADSSESIRSCSVIIKAYQSMPYTEVKDRVKIKGGKDRRVPQVITSTAETSPLPHLPSRKRLHLNIKEQGKEVPEGESEPEMALKESYASLPSPSYLKWDTRMNEEEDTRRITQSYFPPPKIQDPSSSGKKRYTKSFDGCVLKEKDRLKTDLENKMVPIPMALKAKELPLSRVLDTKKLQWKIKEQERKVQKDENDLATHQENICTSVLILPYLKFGSREGEGYMIRITKPPLPRLQSRASPDAVKTTDAETTDGGLSNDVKKLKEHTLPKEARDREKKVDMKKSMVDHNDRYLKAKKSPNFLRNNLSALRRKTEKQEGTAQEGQREPGGAILTKTCTCRSRLLHFNTNTRVEEKRIPILTGSSFPTVGSQESSDSEDMECIEPVTSNILISPQKGKHRMPQNKERDGVEIVNLMFPKHQEKKMQESEDEPRVVVANSSSPSPSLPHLQLDKETQAGDEMLGPARSVVQRESNAGEVVHTEAIRGDVTEDSQNKKRLMPQEEEQDREKTRDRRNMTHTTDISLKSRKSPPSLKLHRTELHLNRGGQEQKKHECPGKPPGTVLRKIYVSQPPAELTLDKGIQVDEERLGIKRPSLIPQMLSAVSDTKMRADTGAICDIRESKQHISQKGKKHEVKTVDMRIMMHHKEARISSISHIFNTKEFVLNIKELKENAYNGKDELPVVLTRTFLSVPSAPSLYLDSGSKADKDVPGLTGSFPPQQNLQESSDTQKTANTEVVAGDGEIVKKAGHSVPQEDTVQQWTSNFMISVRRRNEPPRVKSEGDLSQLVLNSQHENIYLTGFGTITGKRLEYFFTGQEVQPEKYKTETFTTFLSYPTMEPTKIENLKKQTEIVDNLNHKISPNVLVTPPRKITEEIYITFGTPVSAKGFSVAEQDAHQQKTLSKASPGSADSYKFDKREKDVHNNDKVSKMLSPKVLAPQTEGSLEKMNIAESDTSPIIEEQEIVVKKQVVLQSESGHKTWLDSSFSLKFPLQNGRQKMPLETDVHKQMALYPRILILPGIHMDIPVFDTIGGGKEQGLPVPQQEEYILESLQKSLSSHWTFPLQSGDLEGKNKMDTSATISLEQKTVEMEEGELKIDTNVAIRPAADKTEMHKHTMVSLEGSKKRDTSSTVNLNTPSLKTQIPQINTQPITHRANSCPIKQNHKKELEVSGAKQNIQPQKLFQKHVLDSFYANIPLSLKFKSWKGRLTVADLKRELSPKDLTMKIPNHPVSQILNNTGRGTPSNRKKLEYDLKKPKKTVLRSEDASGIFVRSLSISTMSSSQMQEIVDSETNRGREKILCPSEIQQKSPHTQRNSSSTVKEGDQSFTDTAPQDSQPSVVEEQQMQTLPSANSEANLGSETKEKNVIPQTKEERVVPGHDSSGIIKEPDLRMTEEEEKAPKPILTPTEGPLMSDEPEDNCISPPQQGDQSEPIQATTAQNVQQQKTFPGTGPIPPQVKSNEIKVVADSTSAESLLPLFEAIKSIFESQIKNMIYDNICENILEKLKAPKPDDWKLPPCAGSPDTTCTVPPKVQPKPILERFTPKENNKLTNHFESKAFEIKLNLIPEMAKQSFQKLNFYLKQSFSEDNSWRLYPRHKKMCFLSLEGTDTVELHLKQKCAKGSPPVSCTKTLIVSVSSDSEEIITKLRSISKLGSGVSSVTPAKQMPLPHILQNYSVEEKDKLLIHFSMKTLEIQMKAFPRIVRESYAMASPQNIRKPLSKCIHSGFKVPKRKNRILLRFEEKSLHQIDLDLQYKYLHFLLGLPVGSVFPKPTALPKHILKLNTVAICENIDNRGESGGGFCIDTELLEQHISFKNQSPHENSSLRKFLEPTLVCASDPNQQGPVQKDTTALSELKSHMTLEKDKQCHVWFQETDMCKSFDSKTQESTPSLVDSHSTQISEDFTESQTNIESSANLEECSALEAHESEECMFLEFNPYLSQESQNILFELQKGIPLENLYKMKKSKMNLKPLYREDSGSQHIRGCRKHSSIVTPSYESHKSRKYRSSSKMPSPDLLRHGSLNAVEVLSRSSSIPFSEEKSSWTARCRTNHSLAPLTESNIKLHLAKGQGKPHRHLESNEGKKAKSDLFRKNNIHWDCDYSYTWTKEKCTRKKKVHNCESERSNYFASKPKLPSKLHQEDINFHSERKQNQPFFYACIPADSLEIMPQTIRWTVPPRTLRKTNCRVPLVAKISSSFNIWTSSKKFLESLLESFSPVHPN